MRRLECIDKYIKQSLLCCSQACTREQAKATLFDYIELFYNRKRLHSGNGYVAPLRAEMGNKERGHTSIISISACCRMSPILVIKAAGAVYVVGNKCFNKNGM